MNRIALLALLATASCVTVATPRNVTMFSTDHGPVGSGVGTNGRSAKDATPTPGKGYVAAILKSAEGWAGFSLVVVDATGRESWIDFDSSNKVDPGELPISMIELPPGDYRVAAWASANLPAPKPIAASEPIARPFAVRPGHVVFLGRFTGRGKVDVAGNVTTTSWTISSQAFGADEAVFHFRKGFPGFGPTPMECLLCSTPGSGAGAAGAAPALPPGGGFFTEQRAGSADP